MSSYITGKEINTTVTAKKIHKDKMFLFQKDIQNSTKYEYTSTARVAAARSSFALVPELLWKYKGQSTYLQSTKIMTTKL